jgi:hypothetical protein
MSSWWSGPGDQALGGCGASLAQRLAGAAAPALVFWVAVVAVYASTLTGRSAVDTVLARLAAAPTTATVVALILAAAAVLASALVVDRLVEPALQCSSDVTR